jgi:predicted amidophosphoribosyltransferase
MLCAACGRKIKIVRGTMFCKECDTEYDLFDIDNLLIPEPRFVPIRLLTNYAIVDTRRQAVYLILDEIEKAELLAKILNKYFAETALKIKLERHIRHSP